MEEWKNIPKFSKYSCSKSGKIRNNQTHCILSPYKRPSGYTRVYIKDDNKNQRSMYVHQLVALTWIPNPEDKPTVNHINKIVGDNRVENLEWATHQEQSDHKIKFNKENNTSKINKNSNRGIWKCDPKTSQKIKYYKTLNDATLDLNIPEKKDSMISYAALNNTIKLGYKWIYDDHYIEEDNSGEKWKLYHKDVNNEYYISNQGRVRNKKRLLKGNTTEDGYKYIIISGKYKKIHTMVAEKFIENPNNYNIVNHKDGKQSNNVYTNLE